MREMGKEERWGEGKNREKEGRRRGERAPLVPALRRGAPERSRSREGREEAVRGGAMAGL